MYIICIMQNSFEAINVVCFAQLETWKPLSVMDSEVGEQPLFSSKILRVPEIYFFSIHLKIYSGNVLLETCLWKFCHKICLFRSANPFVRHADLGCAFYKKPIISPIVPTASFVVVLFSLLSFTYLTTVVSYEFFFPFLCSVSEFLMGDLDSSNQTASKTRVSVRKSDFKLHVCRFVRFLPYI